MEDPFTYSRAVVCGVPSTLPAAALRMDPSGEPVNLSRARQQHQEYVEVGLLIYLAIFIFTTTNHINEMKLKD